MNDRPETSARLAAATQLLATLRAGRARVEGLGERYLRFDQLVRLHSLGLAESPVDDLRLVHDTIERQLSAWREVRGAAAAASVADAVGRRHAASPEPTTVAPAGPAVVTEDDGDLDLAMNAAAGMAGVAGVAALAATSADGGEDDDILLAEEDLVEDRAPRSPEPAAIEGPQAEDDEDHDDDDQDKLDEPQLDEPQLEDASAAAGAGSPSGAPAVAYDDLLEQQLAAPLDELEEPQRELEEPQRELEEPQRELEEPQRELEEPQHDDYVIGTDDALYVSDRGASVEPEDRAPRVPNVDEDTVVPDDDRPDLPPGPHLSLVEDSSTDFVAFDDDSLEEEEEYDPWAARRAAMDPQEAEPYAEDDLDESEDDDLDEDDGPRPAARAADRDSDRPSLGETISLGPGYGSEDAELSDLGGAVVRLPTGSDPSLEEVHDDEHTEHDMPTLGQEEIDTLNDFGFTAADLADEDEADLGSSDDLFGLSSPRTVGPQLNHDEDIEADAGPDRARPRIALAQEPETGSLKPVTTGLRESLTNELEAAAADDDFLYDEADAHTSQGGFAVSFEQAEQESEEYDVVEEEESRAPRLTDDEPVAPMPSIDDSIELAPVPEVDSQGLANAMEAAHQAERRGDLHEAILRYSDAVELAPDQLDAYLGRGRAHMELGDYASAMSDFQRAEDLAPGNPAPLAEMGNLYFARKEYRRAVDFYDQALDIDPSQAMARCRRGICHHYRRNHKAAFQDLQKAYSLDPDIPNIRKYVQMAVKAMERDRPGRR